MGTPAVQLDSLVRCFGTFRAVDGVSFSVERGEVIGFLGPNGAGKSTTMKMLTGYLQPSEGRALVEGNDAWRAPTRAKALVGYLPEGAPAYAEMTPVAFLRFCARARGVARRDVVRLVEHAAERAGLRHMMRQPIETLSKGYKRRVGLAQAILHDPPVLVLDEPTDGLDPNQKAEVRRLINEMAPEKAVILSTHILEEVEAICTRVVLIAQGTVLADETPGVLRARDPGHQRVTLRCSGANAEVRTALAAIGGVERVEEGPGGGSDAALVVYASGGAPIAGDVAGVCHDRGWAVFSLEVHSGSLDRVFRDLTTRSPEGAA